MNVPGTLLILASSCTTVYSDLTTLNKWINSDYESSKMLTLLWLVSANDTKQSTRGIATALDWWSYTTATLWWVLGSLKQGSRKPDRYAGFAP